MSTQTNILTNVQTDTALRDFHFYFPNINCKEVIVMKKFDFKILTYSFFLRSPEFINTIFAVMYVYMHVYGCVYGSEHNSVKMVNSIELKFGMYITDQSRSNIIDFGECWM